MGDYRTGYQDSWVRGACVHRGERDCERRFAAIRDALVERGLGAGSRVLDLGALTGYFGFRLAEELGVTVVAIDESPILVEHGKRNANPLVEVQRRRVELADVERLEPYDAILCLSLLHWFGPWAGVYNALLARCEWLVVEIPHPGEGPNPLLGSLDEMVRSDPDAEFLVEVHGYRTELLRPTFVVPGGAPEGTPAIVLDGYGEATRNLRPDLVPGHPSADELADATGYTPVAGTLNLRSGSRPSSEPVALEAGLGTYELVPIRVDGVLGHELRTPAFGPRRGLVSDVLEVVGPVSFRKALGVAAGDLVSWDDP